MSASNRKVYCITCKQCSHKFAIKRSRSKNFKIFVSLDTLGKTRLIELDSHPTKAGLRTDNILCDNCFEYALKRLR